MDVKSGSGFENLDAVEELSTHRRVGKVKMPVLAKSSQKERRSRRPAKVRTINAINLLRLYGANHRINDTSIDSLAAILSDNNIQSLVHWDRGKNVKTAFYQLALRESEEQDRENGKPDSERLRLVPFTMNLSQRLQQQMYDSIRQEVTCCMEKIKKAIEKYLKRRSVDLWFQIEMAPRGGKGKPHIQGALLIRKGEEELAKKALHFANGGFIARAVKFSYDERIRYADEKGLLHTDLNWASYSTKEEARTRIEFIDGNVFTASQGLNQRAKELYGRLRLALVDQTQFQLKKSK